MSAKDADDAGGAGDVVHYGHPPKSTRFLTPRGDAQKAAKNRLNKSANPSPLIRVGPAWRRAKVRRWVGGMGRTALYLKVGPVSGQGPPVAGFKGCRPAGLLGLGKGSLGNSPNQHNQPAV